MPGLQVFQYAVLTDALGNRHTLGSMVDPANLSSDFDGVVERQVFSIAAAGREQVYIPSTSASETTFTFLWIRANVEDVYVQLTTDSNNGVGLEETTIELRKGLAFILGSPSTYALYTAPFASGTLDIIDEIHVKNTGSETATVEVVVAR